MPLRAADHLELGLLVWATMPSKLGYDYDSQGAWDAVHSLSESFQYFLLKSSNEIAKEKGHCEYFRELNTLMGSFLYRHL